MDTPLRTDGYYNILDHGIYLRQQSAWQYLSPADLRSALAEPRHLDKLNQRLQNPETITDDEGNRYSLVTFNSAGEHARDGDYHLVLPTLTGTHQDELYAYRLKLFAANHPQLPIVALDPLGHGKSSNLTEELKEDMVGTGSFWEEGRLLAQALTLNRLTPNQVTAYSKSCRLAFTLMAYLPAGTIRSATVFDSVGSTRLSYAQIAKAFLVDEKRHDRLYVENSRDKYELEIRHKRQTLKARLGKMASYLSGIEKVISRYTYIPIALGKGARRPDLVYASPIAREMAEAMNRHFNMRLNYIWFKDSHLKRPRYERELIKQMSRIYGDRFNPIVLEGTHAMLSGNAALGQKLIDLAHEL